jgi:hypothetical protein
MKSAIIAASAVAGTIAIGIGATAFMVLPASASQSTKPAPPVLATQTVTATSAGILPGATGSVTAACPAGWNATGGGFSQNHAAQDGPIIITASQPANGGWTVTAMAAFADTTEPATVTAYAVCSQIQ